MRSAFALRIFSGKNIYNFAILENLRIFQNCLFTGGVVEENGICSAAFCESAALRLASSPSQALTRQIPHFVTYGDIFPRSGGSLSSKGEPLAKLYTLQFNRKLCRHAKASPFGRGGTAQAVTERASTFEIFPPEKGCLPSGRQPFSEENKENTRPKGQSEYQNILSSL